MSPSRALQASMSGSGWQPLICETYIFASSLAYFNINTLDHMKKLKDSALVGNIVHF